MGKSRRRVPKVEMGDALMNARPLTPELVAEKWGVTTNHIRSLIKRGALQAFTIGRLIRIPHEAVEAFEARDPSRGTTLCDVYMIRCCDFVKIGKAERVEERFACLQAMNPYELELLHVLKADNGHRLESRLHKRFAAHRHKGEWFRFEGELAKWIKEGCPL
jgi:excisionase family DNA binding protein